MLSIPRDPQVSVIILYEGDLDNLTRCVDSVPDDSIQLQLIILNSGKKSGLEIESEFHGRFRDIICIDADSNTSVSRNEAIKVATGDYILFLRSTDTLKKGAVGQLYKMAVFHNLDVMGGAVLGPDDVGLQSLPEGVLGEVLTGPEYFISSVKNKTYSPLIYGYMYKTCWLMEQQLYFEEDYPDSDEIWVQEMLCCAGRVFITDLKFYHLNLEYPLIHYNHDERAQIAVRLLGVADRLLQCAEKYSFEGPEKGLKSWIYVNALRVYRNAFQIITTIRTHIGFEVPDHKMHTFATVAKEIVPEALDICRRSYKVACDNEHEYLTWKDNPLDRFILKMPEDTLATKKIILIYNGPSWHDYAATMERLPADYTLTMDHKYLSRAFAVVFHLPGLNMYIHDGIEKADNQIWVGWNMEPETKLLWTEGIDMGDFFDVRMDYHPDADVVCPYYGGFKPEKVAQHIDPKKKKNKICMLISSHVNESYREEYLAELMKYIEIDSFGRLYNNRTMEGEDKGRESKIALYRQYKFVIAFENSILDDYVTEKLYDPLIAGAVPIYFGAPNVTDYLPDMSCLVNTTHFASPKELAEYIELCYRDDSLYMKHHKWRNQSWDPDFTKKVKILDIDPFIRLCSILNHWND